MRLKKIVTLLAGLSLCAPVLAQGDKHNMGPWHMPPKDIGAGIFDAPNFVEMCADIDKKADYIDKMSNEDIPVAAMALLMCGAIVKSAVQTIEMDAAYTVQGRRICLQQDLQGTQVLDRVQEIAKEQPEMIAKGTPTMAIVMAAIATLSPCR